MQFINSIPKITENPHSESMRIFCYAEGVAIGRMTVTGLAFQPVADDNVIGIAFFIGIYVYSLILLRHGGPYGGHRQRKGKCDGHSGQQGLNLFLFHDDITS